MEFSQCLYLIASFLELADLQTWRLVCRSLNKQTLDRFGHLLFTTVQTDLTADSLQRLQKVSESEHIRQNVRCLEVIKTKDGFLGKGSHWPRLPSGCLAEDLEGGEMLQNLVSQRFLKCRSFVIISWDEYGEPIYTDRLIPSDAVGLLFISVRASLPIHSFAIRRSSNGTARLETLRLQTALLQRPEFGTIWSHVEELSLNCGVQEDQWDWVLNLIVLASRLRKLLMSAHEVDVTFMQRLNASKALNRLEELTLRGAMVSVDDISSVLLRNRATVQSFSISYSRMHEDGRWSTVFRNMQGQFSRLQKLEVLFLKEGNMDLMSTSPFLRYPVAPGTVVMHNLCLRSEVRRLEPMQDTVKLRYWGGQKGRLRGLEYYGQEMELVLDLLAQSMEGS